VTLVLLFFGSLLGLLFPYLAGLLVSAARSQLDGVEATSWTQSINTIALVTIGVLAAQAALSFWRAVWAVETSEKALADLRRDTYSRLIHLPLSFHHARRVGELTSRLSADLVNIRDMLVESFPHFLRQIVILVGGIVFLLVTSLRLTL